jgi:hypothetical protein
VVEEIVPDARIALTDCDDNSEDAIPSGASRVVVEPANIAGGTLVTLTHSGVPREKLTGPRMGSGRYLSALANDASIARAVAQSP